MPHEQLDDALYVCFVQKRSEGLPLSGPFICGKALFFNSKLNGDQNFKAIVGWLHNFKRRHGIRELNIEVEKLSAASSEVVDSFKNELKKLIEESELCRDQVYNADETGIIKHYRLKHWLLYRNNTGFKIQKQRITAMRCANASKKYINSTTP